MSALSSWRERLNALALPLRAGGSPKALAAAALRALRIDDPGGLLARELAGRLGRRPDRFAEALQDTLRQAPSLEPAARLLVGHMLAGRHAAPLVSLGTHCYTSAMMKRWNLKPWSGPFDWLFASVPMVTHCIEDDFQVFLDRTQYEPVPLEQRTAGHAANRVHHRLYRERYGIEFVFNHHDVHLDEDYAYLRRCVGRFREALASSRPHAFVLTSWRYLGFEEDIGRLNAALRARSSSFKLVAIGVSEALGAPAPKLQNMHHDDTCDMFFMEPCTRWEPLSFPDFLDEYALVQTVLGSCMRDQR